MLRSVNPTWAEPKMKPRGAEKLFKSVTKYVESRLERGAEVEIAQIGPACDGMAALNFLADVGCCTSECPPSSGPFVLANRKHGIPTLLSSAVSRPFAGMSGAPTVVTNVRSGAALSGRFFVDVLGNLFEGRNYAYHAGQRVVRQPNGTPIVHAPIGYQDETLIVGDINTGWGMIAPEGGDHSQHRMARWGGVGIGWVGVTADSSPVQSHGGATPYYAVGTSPHFCRTASLGSLEPFVPSPSHEDFPVTSLAYTAHEKALKAIGWLGTCPSNGGGYRASDSIVASIEGFDPYAQIHTTTLVPATHYRIWLCFRDATTLAMVAHVELTDVESYANTFVERNTTEAGVFRWRAGVQVRRALDGTWIVSILDGAKAWVYECTRRVVSVEGVPAPIYSTALLETVTLKNGAIHNGALRVVYF